VAPQKAVESLQGGRAEQLLFKAPTGVRVRAAALHTVLALVFSHEDCAAGATRAA